MVKDDGKQWLLELTQNITIQLREDRADIMALREAITKGREMHTMCREQIFEKIADLDKRLEITIVKVGALVALVVTAAEYLFNFLLGK